MTASLKPVRARSGTSRWWRSCRRGGSGALNLGRRHRLSALASGTLIAAGLARRPRVAAGSLVALLALNASFYRLLLRREGAARAGAGVALHVVHHVTGGAAMLLAMARHVQRGC